MRAPVPVTIHILPVIVPRVFARDDVGEEAADGVKDGHPVWRLATSVITPGDIPDAVPGDIRGYPMDGPRGRRRHRP